ncbi:MAG: hypothetical protein ACK553_19320 [Planctomycetota bacterium]
MHDLVRIFRCPLWIIPMLLGVADSSSAQSPNAPPPNNQPSSAQPSRAKGSTPLAFYGEGYVLLQHGNVLHGFVKPHADRVTITLDKGNEVTVPNRQVLTIGKSVESLYSFQVRAIRRWGTGEHWHLAHWCIQNGLLDQAIEHYNELEKTVKDSPKFKQLDLQLRQALLADAQVQQALQAQGIPNPIAPASYDQHAEGSESSAAVARREENPEPEPLSPFVPGYLRRSFQIDVLPIVVSRCGQAGCHGMLSKNDFQVFQPVGEQAASISQRNLDSLMAYVDHSDPAQTSLVQYAVRPHGAQRNPSIQTNREEDRALMDKLVHWLRSVKDAENGTHSSHVIPGGSPNSQKTEKSSVAPAMALIPKSAVQQQIRRRSSGDGPPQDRNAKLSKPPKSAPAPVVLNALELSEIEDAIAQLEQKHQEKPSSRDPFDPAVFNAKFATEKPPSK